MNREEYFMCLDGYLRKLTDEERMEAIQFYQDYFDEAGPENEQSVIDNLGSPRDLAQSILDGEKTGEFTENGYKRSSEKTTMDIVPQSESAKAEAEKKANDADNTKLVIGIVLLIIFSPLFISLAGTLLGMIVGFSAASLALVVSGMVLLFSSIAVMFGSVGIGVMLLGISLIVVALGIIFGLLVDLIVRGLIPLCVKLGKMYTREFFGKKQ